MPGIPPFGLGPGSPDPRHMVLASVLQHMWHSQASCLILECTPEFERSAPAMQCLGSFADRAGLVLQHTTLELADQWASYKCRWWAILSPAGLQLEVCPWPVLGSPPKVQDVIPEWPAWPKAIETALLWDAKELEIIGDSRLDSEPRTLVASE